MVPTLKYKVGDKVIVTGYGDGTVTTTDPHSTPSYCIELDSTKSKYWAYESQLTPQLLSGAVTSHYVVPPAHQTPVGLDALDLGAWTFGSMSTGYVSTDERLRRRQEGRCEECGELLPMSIHGLGECPQHPKPLPPDFKQ